MLEMKQSKRGILVNLALLAIILVTFSSNRLCAQKISIKKGEKILVHQVYFWLKKDLNIEQKKAFEKGLKSLTTIKSIKFSEVGKPASTTPRPVIDASYDYSLMIIFENIAAHDAYQIDATHELFLKNCKEFWDKVQVYDASTL